MHIVTGGGTGIGRAVALALHAQGHPVLITGRRQAPLDEVVERSNGEIVAVRCDNATPDGVRAMAAQAGAQVDGLVHCAGGNPAIGRPDPDSLEAEAALLEETIGANLTSAALTVSGVSQRMAAGSSIVLVGSIAAERGVGYYGPAKAAVASYAVGLAAQLGSRGIRVNCISPGYIAETEFFNGTLSQEREEQLRAQTALGHTGLPEDAVTLTQFLLSPAARTSPARTSISTGVLSPPDEHTAAPYQTTCDGRVRDRPASPPRQCQAGPSRHRRAATSFRDALKPVAAWQPADSAESSRLCGRRALVDLGAGAGGSMPGFGNGDGLPCQFITRPCSRLSRPPLPRRQLWVERC